MKSTFSFENVIVRHLRHLNETSWTDVELRSNDDGSIMAHRCILAMNSILLDVRCRQATRAAYPPVIELPFSKACLLLCKRLMYKGVVVVDETQREEFTAFLDEYGLLSDVTETQSGNYSDFVPPGESTRMNDNVEVNDGGEGNDNNVEDDGDEDHVDEDDVEEEEEEVHDEDEQDEEEDDEEVPDQDEQDEVEDDEEEEDHEEEEDAADGEEARGISAGQSIDQERDRDDTGNDGLTDPHDRTIATSAVEIVLQLIEFGKTGKPSPNRSYSLRYWLAVILHRWKSVKTDQQLESMMKIPRRTLSYNLSKHPAEEDFQHPSVSKRERYPATSADQIVHHLCHPDEVIGDTDNTYTLRLWLSVILHHVGRGDRTLKTLERLLGISVSKISRAARNGLDPASTDFVAASDT